MTKKTLAFYGLIVCSFSLSAAETCTPSSCDGTAFEKTYKMLLKENIIGEKNRNAYGKACQDLKPLVEETEAVKWRKALFAGIPTGVVMGGVSGMAYIIDVAFSGAACSGPVAGMILAGSATAGGAVAPYSLKALNKLFSAPEYQSKVTKDGKVNLTLEQINDGIKDYFNNRMRTLENAIVSQADKDLEETPDLGICDIAGWYDAQYTQTMFNKYKALEEINAQRTADAKSMATDLEKLCNETKKKCPNGETSKDTKSAVVDDQRQVKKKSNRSTGHQQSGDSSKESIQK